MDDSTLLAWIEKGQNIAAFFVAIGVAAEFLLGYMAGPARKRVELARETEIVRLNTESGKAQKDAAQANERASVLEQENLKLREKLAPRRLTVEQHRTLVALLSKKPGTIIIESMQDSESALFASDIQKTFTDAGWKIGGTFFPMSVVWTGLVIYNTSDPDALTAGQALKEAKVPFSIGTETRAKATIMIGGKPPMF